MVKGISRQVIVVNTPDPRLFEQAIFILKEDIGEGVTDEILLKEARQAIQSSTHKKRHLWLYGAFWAVCGASATGILWLISWML